MKFNCNKKDLVDAISVVQKAVAAKSTISILEGILIEAKGQTITLKGTDIDVSIETVFVTEVQEEGKLVVDSKMFGDIIRKLPNNVITIESLENNILNISAERSEFNLVYMEPNEYPEFPVIEDSTKILVSQDKLKNMIKKVLFSVATEDTRPILMGVYFEVKEQKLNLVALDGYRMALATETIDSNENFSSVVSGKTLRDISSLLQDTDQNISLSFTDNHVLFEINSTKIISRLLQGEFIKYQNMIPDYSKLNVKINKDDLYEATERASVMANEGSSNLIKLNFEDDIVLVSSNSKLGKVKEEVNIEKDGDSLEIAFNAKYIIDILKVMDEETILLELTSNISPCIIKPIENDNSLYLVLPVRIAR